MRDDELKIVALALIGVMGVVAVYPTLASRRIVEPFSELGVLGPLGKLGDYPSQVAVGERFNLFLFVSNYEGKAEYYRVEAKLGDKSSVVNETTRLSVDPFAAWDFVLMNGENSTLPITLSLGEQGLDRRLVFELHRFDTDTEAFVYHQRWVQLWMNVTRTS